MRSDGREKIPCIFRVSVSLMSIAESKSPAEKDMEPAQSGCTINGNASRSRSEIYYYRLLYCSIINLLLINYLIAAHLFSPVRFARLNFNYRSSISISVPRTKTFFERQNHWNYHSSFLYTWRKRCHHSCYNNV